ncbi:hypothetical protein [Dyadobacter sp. NIV53]|uniref:hypothetical protein n=1 Tax=Dyadobacter sp. NIV53 TaxID=2861765 RepID=UPI001C88AB88|nr:hypothetical protein [Dyadobacter sp. NIV53]
MSKTVFLWISGTLLFLAGTGIWVWNRFGPSRDKIYSEKVQNVLIAKTLDSSSKACDLTVRRYKQIGKEMQFELAANASGLAPYDVEISQNGFVQQFGHVQHRHGTWLTLTKVTLKQGPATIKVTSLGQAGCGTTASFYYDATRSNEILAEEKWVRKGSKDIWLDIRPVQKDGRIYLKDFANYDDGRTRVIMIDGIAVNNMNQGIEVKPGYLYSVTARWIDAPYNDWWNKLRNRTVRQQNIWIDGHSSVSENSQLTQIATPEWFSPSRTINADFDTKFPEFEPIAGKMVMQYRLNAYVSPENYFKRGINYLYGWEKDLPVQKLHWTATPNNFGDKDEKWFGSLSKQEVESIAHIPDFAVYAFDFEFWNQHYTPEVKQRLIWFTEPIRKAHPNLRLMDYWGGGAYTNPHISNTASKDPLEYVKDYENPKSNNSNFDPLPNGESFQNLFNVTPIDVYPKAMFAMDAQGNTVNNYVLLSAIHSMRINKLIPYQKNNKFIFYGWNKYQPLYGDPVVPWNFQTTNPKGELILNQLEIMPASQALSLSLFSLILFDGYYLWSDSGPAGNDPNGYNIPDEASGWYKEWHPADGKTDISAIKRAPGAPATPTYWDYPTEYYVLGNWMAKQVEDILIGGINQDLPFELNGKWIEPKKEQAILAIDRKEPFVTAIVKGNQIAVLAVDSFQAPNASKKVNVKLPDGNVATIELYGNWPVLYRGKLKK